MLESWASIESRHESQKQLRGFENVSRASIDIGMNSNRDKFQLRVN